MRSWSIARSRSVTPSSCAREPTDSGARAALLQDVLSVAQPRDLRAQLIHSLLALGDASSRLRELLRELREALLLRVC